MDSITKGFGECLKTHRKQKNLTQGKLAKFVGINLRQLARIEAGESFVSSETLQKLCDVLNLAPKCFFDFCVNEHNIVNDSVSNDKDYIEFYKNIAVILQDKNKVKYINLAFKSLNSKKAVKELKTMLNGIELLQE